MATAVSIVDGSWVVSEGDRPVQVTLMTSEPVPFGELLLVDFEIVPGTAVPKEDYQYLSPSAVFIQQTGVYADRINIPSGASIGSILIDLLEDGIAEDNESFSIRIVGVSPSYEIGENASIEVTILDRDVSTVVYRVNAGGSDIIATDGGPNWLPDDAFLLNPQSTSAYTTSIEVALHDAVPDTTPRTIFDTERFGFSQNTDSASMQYAFAVEPGVYEVRLYLANTFDGTSLPGQRVFDIAIENQISPTLNDIDPAARFGHLVGGFLSEKIEVKDGALNIDFFHDSLGGIENPFVNAIEIIQIDDGNLAPTISLASGSYIVGEGERFAQFTLLASEPVPPAENVTITFELVPNSAQPLEDYVYESVTATFDPVTGIYTDTATIPSGFSVASIFVNILPDLIAEGDEAFAINIVSVDSYFKLGENDSILVKISEDGFNPNTPGSEAENIVSSADFFENLSPAFGDQLLRYDEGSLMGKSAVEFEDVNGAATSSCDIFTQALDYSLAGVESIPQLTFEVNAAPVGELVPQNLSLGDVINFSSSIAGAMAAEGQLGTGHPSE